MSDLSAVPSFRRGVKFRFDEVRSCWVLLAPERLLLPDEIAVEILKLVDGVRSIEAIARELATRFDAPVEVITADVAEALENLARRGAVQL
jgi:pyrroloquinoline quinone biosynthesis protein D